MIDDYCENCKFYVMFSKKKRCNICEVFPWVVHRDFTNKHRCYCDAFKPRAGYHKQFTLDEFGHYRCHCAGDKKKD